MQTVKRIFLLGTLFGFSLLNAQTDETAVKYASTIEQDDLKKHLTILSSDKYEGRETGQKGQRMAADYLINQFEDLGLTPGNNGEWLQEFPLNVKKLENVHFDVNGNNYTFLEDFYSFPSNTKKKIDASNVVFLGYGIDDEKYSDYKGRNVKGKLIMVSQGEPLNPDGMSLINPEKEASKWSTNWRAKLGAAYEHGAKGIIIIDKNLEKNAKRFGSFITGSSMSLPGDGDDEERKYADAYYISKEMAASILGVKDKRLAKVIKKMKKKNLPVMMTGKSPVKIKVEKDAKVIESSNVLGFLEGSDPKLKDEIIVVTSHYDHLGKKGDNIYNGADDDGSGTVTVIELAEAFTEAKKNGQGPRRSILFMPVSGEEKGLLGSQYYSENPVYDLKNTVCNINIDMVGRVDEKHAESGYYVYVIGADRLSSDLHNINEAMNKTYTNIELDYEFNEPDDPNQFYYRSDHYNFAKNGIPVIFYFTGVHEDYHKPTDTVEKIEFDRIQKIGQLAFHTVWELANRDDRIVVDKEDKSPPKR